MRLCKNKEDAVVIENEERDDVDLNKQRNLAIQELIAIEAKFAEVRDKLFKDKLSLLEKNYNYVLMAHIQNYRKFMEKSMNFIKMASD